MIPLRLRLFLLISLVVAFVTMPLALAQQRQRRVFTNEDVASPAPAAPTPAEKPAAPAEKPAAGESAPATPAAAEQPGGAPPPGGLALAQSLQGTLRRFHSEFADKLDQETDASRQGRWRTMMDLTMQLMTQNQQYISELESAAKAAAPAPENAPPPPTNPQ